MWNPFGTTTFRSAQSPDELTLADVADLIRKGRLRASDSLTHAGEAEWKPAGQFPELQRYFERRVAMALRPRDEKVIDRRVFLAIFVAGLLLFAWIAHDLWFVLSTAHWRHTLAVVTENGGFGQGAYLRYAYDVDGKRYQGYDPGGVAEVGNHLHVYYDPMRPAQSTRYHGTGLMGWSIVIAAAAMIVGGVCGLVWPRLVALWESFVT